MGGRPVLFTVAFRQKMAALTQEQRQEWLVSLASNLASGRPSDAVLECELREVARGCRLHLVESVQKELGPFDPAHLRALLDVPRERFVQSVDIVRSADDVPLPLDPVGLATISAPHAYLLSYRLIALGSGDVLVELGTGSGYGAALAATIAGPAGRVTSFEIDPDLAHGARQALERTSFSNAVVIHADAMTSASRWGAAKKVVVTFAVDELPSSWLRALPDGGMLVAPVGPADVEQSLVLATKRGGRVVETRHGAVRYVRNRSPK